MFFFVVILSLRIHHLIWESTGRCPFCVSHSLASLVLKVFTFSAFTAFWFKLFHCWVTLAGRKFCLGPIWYWTCIFKLRALVLVLSVDWNIAVAQWHIPWCISPRPSPWLSWRFESRQLFVCRTQVLEVEAEPVDRGRLGAISLQPTQLLAFELVPGHLCPSAALGTRQQKHVLSEDGLNFSTSKVWQFCSKGWQFCMVYLGGLWSTWVVYGWPALPPWLNWGVLYICVECLVGQSCLTYIVAHSYVC